MLETAPTFRLKSVFQDADFAWRLLQAQISIQMRPVITGQQIAKLLQLYMKGVQKMNSVSDLRQSYFKNKVTSLMAKGAVIKSLKKNPMKKKPKHQQASCRQQSTSKKKASQKKPQPQVQPVINHLQLKQKQSQFQMRVAYSAHQNNPDALRKLLLQQQCREENISKKISNIINNHEQRLKQRIRLRKLKTSTYRTNSEFNKLSQTQPSTDKFKSDRKEEYFQQNEMVKQTHTLDDNKNRLKDNCSRKWKSLQNSKIQQHQPQKKRKYTLDLK